MEPARKPESEPDADNFLRRYVENASEAEIQEIEELAELDRQGPPADVIALERSSK